ncbi:class F sortase [Streptomyces sp. SID8379]|uniref:class F sortase n=1 Tax=unclassified Streptomyces TaxID=2593676 RepID=UPI0003755014|nr:MULTISPECIES: class F sortase [unclassified Streptomyces]MYW70485.1 class F sortase [Streptomyces sp. SID8379]
MTDATPPGRDKRRDLPWIGAAVLCGLLAVCSVLTWFDASGSGAGPGAADPGRPVTGSVRGDVPGDAAAALSDRPGGRAAPPQAEAPDPIRLRIPSIGVDTAVGPLSLDSEGRLPAPGGYADVGWWREGVAPGESGPAVIAGHLDTPTGPAVFANLAELRPGDRMEITRADLTTAVFEVLGTMEFPQDAFPTEVVYGRTPDAQLRLITCGGAYDRTAGRYLANTVVYAAMVTA